MLMKVAVRGGGPAGATAASILAKAGVETYLIEKDLNGDKPCGGGIPSGSLNEVDIPDHMFERKVKKVGIIAPSGYEVIAEVKDGYVGMVDRVKFDPWLREKAVESGARLIEGVFTSLSQSGNTHVNFKQGEKEDSIEVDAVIAADGANSAVAREIGAERPQVYLTVQEKVELTGEAQKFYEDRCEFWYGADISPNFYGWVFPKGSFATIGIGGPSGHGKFMDDYMAAFKKRLRGRFGGGKRLKKQALPFTVGALKEN